MSESDTQSLMEGEEMAAFLQTVYPRFGTSYCHPCCMTNEPLSLSASLLPLSLSLSHLLPRVCDVRLEICLQQNLIMDLFVDDCRALSDEDWMSGSNSGTHLKVSILYCITKNFREIHGF